MYFNIFGGIIKAKNYFNHLRLSEGDWTILFVPFKYTPQIVFEFTVVNQVKNFL